MTKDYQVPESKIVLTKGTTIIVSVYGIHHDSSIYENPESYDPDRFTPENISKRHQMSFIPFGNFIKKVLWKEMKFKNNYNDIGQGARVCIGERFGYLETKVGLVTLLSKFRFTPSSKTKMPISFSKKNVILSPEGGMFLHVEKI